jgi:AraC-like DNA-binding protein
MAERLFLRLDGDPLYAEETSVPAGTMREFAVAPALVGQVAHVAAYREQLPAGCETVERVLPDGSVHLIFHAGNQPSLLAAGAVAAPTLVRLRGRIDGLSVRLVPGTAAAVLGQPASEIAGAAVPLTEVWGPDADRLLGRLADATDDAARVAALQAALARRVVHRHELRRRRHGENARRAVLQAVRRIAASGGREPLPALAASLALGERRLQQLFQAEVGLSPRAFGRIARLHACLRALRREGQPQWSHVAVEAGFYDQSHLVNEFRSLCGLSPGEFLDLRRVSVSSKTQR